MSGLLGQTSIALNVSGWPSPTAHGSCEGGPLEEQHTGTQSEQRPAEPVLRRRDPVERRGEVDEEEVRGVQESEIKETCAPWCNHFQAPGPRSATARSQDAAPRIRAQATASRPRRLASPNPGPRRAIRPSWGMNSEPSVRPISHTTHPSRMRTACTIAVTTNQIPSSRRQGRARTAGGQRRASGDWEAAEEQQDRGVTEGSPQPHLGVPLEPTQPEAADQQGRCDPTTRWRRLREAALRMRAERSARRRRLTTAEPGSSSTHRPTAAYAAPRARRRDRRARRQVPPS